MSMIPSLGAGATLGDELFKNIVTPLNARTGTAQEMVLNLIYKNVTRVIPDRVWSTPVNPSSSEELLLLNENGEKLNSFVVDNGDGPEEWILPVTKALQIGTNHIAIVLNDRLISDNRVIRKSVLNHSSLLLKVDDLSTIGLANIILTGQFILLDRGNMRSKTISSSIKPLNNGMLIVRAISGFYGSNQGAYRSPYNNGNDYTYGIIDKNNGIILPFIYSELVYSSDDISSNGEPSGNMIIRYKLLDDFKAKSDNKLNKRGYRVNSSGSIKLNHNGQVNRIYSIEPVIYVGNIKNRSSLKPIVCVGFRADTTNLVKARLQGQELSNKMISLDTVVKRLMTSVIGTTRIKANGLIDSLANPMVYNGLELEFLYTLGENTPSHEVFSQIEPDYDRNSIDNYTRDGHGPSGRLSAEEVKQLKKIVDHYKICGTNTKKKGILDLFGRIVIPIGMFDYVEKIGNTNFYKVVIGDDQGIWNVVTNSWVHAPKARVSYYEGHQNDLIVWKAYSNGIAMYIGNDGGLYRDIKEAFGVYVLEPSIANRYKDSKGSIPHYYIESYGNKAYYTSEFKRVKDRENG